MKLTDIVKLIGQAIRLARFVSGLTGGTAQVEGINITNGGSGYSNSFAVTFTGGGGSGGAGTATAIDGVIRYVTITNNGSGYTSTPSPVFTAGGGTGAAGTVLMSATTLDAIKTTTVNVGLIVFFQVADMLYFYKLTAATTAEASPTIIRPDDYATTTNEKVWKLQGAVSLTTIFPNSTAPGADPVDGQLWASSGELQYRTSGASEGSGQTNRVHNRQAQVIGSGTDYTLTGATARVDFGTTDAEVTLPSAGTFLIIAVVELLADAAGAGDLVHCKLRNATDSVDVGTERRVVMAANSEQKLLTLVEPVVVAAASKLIQIFAHNATSARGSIVSTRTSIQYVRLS